MGGMAEHTQDTYSSLIAELRELSMLGSINAVLGWDEQTHLPTRGTEYRAEQSSLLARMVHERRPMRRRMGQWLGNWSRRGRWGIGNRTWR